MEKYLYEEVYVVGTDGAVSYAGELTICGSFEDLLSYLKTKNVSINSDLRVLHGVLTPAKTIPNDFKNRQPFILLKDPDSTGHGIMLDADAENDCNELALEIEMILDAERSEEIASFFFEIDHIYILYGYELSLTLSIDEGDLDEEIIENCLDVAKEARKLNTEDD